MNYFAHGYRYIDRPYFLAGTAVPDWLSVADRKVRMREKRVEPVLSSDDAVTREVAFGIRQHLEDDNWFHGQPAFVILCSDMTQLFKRTLGAEDGFRPSFLGHIVSEMLLDSVLIARNRSLLDDYYNVLRSIQPHSVQATVNLIGKHQTDRLTRFIDLFCREQFLYDYLDMKSLLYRLNQVMRRVKLQALPEKFIHCLEAGRAIVDERASQLLPATCHSVITSGRTTTNEVRTEHVAVDGQR